MTDLTAHFILYVADQERAKAFYARVLDREPRLHVPGMTEFDLGGNAVLGLMPERGIRKLLGSEHFPDAAPAPRAELYLVVEDPESFLARAKSAGAIELSPLLPRDWGHTAGYSLDPDAHVLAFASLTARS
jgi:catechol 2,3-dioxygenase-like lactoylglutathione lyase family enzyme